MEAKIKRTVLIFIILLTVVPTAYNAVGQPTLVWHKTYINEDMPKKYHLLISNRFDFDPTDSNKILNVFVAEATSGLGTSTYCFWNMTLLNTNTGEFVGEPIALDTDGAHPQINYFLGLGRNLRNITYYVENDTLNFVTGASFFGFNALPAFFPIYPQNFKVHLSDDGLNLQYYPNGTIFPNTAIVRCPITDTLLNRLALFRTNFYAELYHGKEFGLMANILDTVNRIFTICSIDTTQLDVWHFNKTDNTPDSVVSYKWDTLKQENVFENVTGVSDDYFDNKRISTKTDIDIDDTLSVAIFPVQQGSNVVGCIIAYWNRATGIFYDKIFSQLTVSNRYNYYSVQDNMLYTMRSSTNGDIITITKKSVYDTPPIINENYTVARYNTPLLNGRNLSGRPFGSYIANDSTFYIYGGLLEAGSTPKVYLAKYKLSNNQSELLWEGEWETSNTLMWNVGNRILVRGNDVYLVGYQNASNNTGAERPFIAEYFKISGTTSVEEVENNLFSNWITVYPNPTSHTLTAEVLYTALCVEELEIGLYNILGQKVLDLNNDYEFNESAHKILINSEIPKEIKKGVYYLNVRNGADFKASAVVVVIGE